MGTEKILGEFKTEIETIPASCSYATGVETVAARSQ
jgi:hypothetical protein